MSYSVNWFEKNIPTWEKILSEFKDKPIQAIELGSYEGQSAVWLLENILTHPASTLDCVDTWEGGVEHKPEDMAAVKERFDENIKPHLMKVNVEQCTTLDYLKRTYKPADLIYIDASHLAPDVLIDAVLSHVLLKPGGILIFDDYLWGAGLAHIPITPKAGIDAFMECFAYEYQPLVIGDQVMLRKKDGQNKD